MFEMVLTIRLSEKFLPSLKVLKITLGLFSFHFKGYQKYSHTTPTYCISKLMHHRNHTALTGIMGVTQSLKRRKLLYKQK